jgi:hypothetical protein
MMRGDRSTAYIVLKLCVSFHPRSWTKLARNEPLQFRSVRDVSKHRDAAAQRIPVVASRKEFLADARRCKRIG